MRRRLATPWVSCMRNAVISMTVFPSLDLRSSKPKSTDLAKACSTLFFSKRKLFQKSDTDSEIFGFAQAWEERPGLVLVAKDNPDLTPLGENLVPAMTYTKASGGQNAAKLATFPFDRTYVYNLAY